MVPLPTGISAVCMSTQATSTPLPLELNGTIVDRGRGRGGADRVTGRDPGDIVGGQAVAVAATCDQSEDGHEYEVARRDRHGGFLVPDWR